MNYYSQYFDVDEGFYPEINPSSMKDEENRWEKTFPHKTIVELISAMERMLARGSNTDKKGLWIEGAYGTGKSRVAWMLKSLLDCKPEELTQYFSDYEALQGEIDLRDKLLHAKEEKIVTVYRYSSGDITSPDRLVAAVYNEVANALTEAGVTYKGEETLRGKMAEWMSDETRKRYFAEVLTKPEYRGLSGLSGKSVDDIIAQLEKKQTSMESVDTLVQSLTFVAEKEGITAFQISHKDLISWISDVIETNNLKGIVFVWDEFSSYFKQNRNSLDVMQALVEFSNEAPFYFVIVTHVSGSLVNDDSNQAYKVISDRFIRKEITLPDNIAFELIAHAFQVKEAAKEQWAKLTDDLNGTYINDSRNAVATAIKVDESLLSKLLPIHPMAALLLKNISAAFASNQRSMFNFIKNEDPDVKAFQWFINNYSPNNADFLTIDHLWDFFYEKGGDEYSSGVGKQNLDSMVSNILGTYSSSESMLISEDEKVVLKTILMLQAISLKIKNGQKLFLPNRKNLNYAFEGTKLLHGHGITIAESLVKKGILFEKPSADKGMDTFAAAAMVGDQASIEVIENKLKSEIKTITLVEQGDFNSVLTLTPGQNVRYILRLATVDNLNRCLKGILNESKTYKIFAILCFSRNEEEQGKMKKLLKEAVENPEYAHIALIDASSSLMGQDEYEQWIKNSAQELYWQEKPGSAELAKEMKSRANKHLSDWKQKISEGSFLYYPAVFDGSNSRQPDSCLKKQNLSESMTGNTLKLYPFSFDNAQIAESLFTSASNSPQGAKLGLEQEAGGRFNGNQIANMLKEAWQKGDEKYWELYPNLAISKLKIKVEQHISDALAKDVRVSVGSIFDMLMEDGFMPCNLYAFLTGFLLKEYRTSAYRYVIGEDGDMGGVMNSEEFSNHIGEYVKHKISNIKGYKPKYIAVMTQNQQVFLNFAKEVFQVENQSSVEEAVNKVRGKMKQLGYPIWCYRFVDTNQMGQYLEKLSDIMNITGSSVSSIAEELGDMLHKTPSAINVLSHLLTHENGASGIEFFISQYESGVLFQLGEELGIAKAEITNKVREKTVYGHGAWLWDESTNEDILQDMILDYKIVSGSRVILPEVNSMASCKRAWKEKVDFLKIPASTLKERFEELEDFFHTLEILFQENEFPTNRRGDFSQRLLENASTIQHIFQESQQIFGKEFSVLLQNLSESDISNVYSKLPNRAFLLDRATFTENVTKLVKTTLSEQKKHELNEEWQKLTQTSSPREWSKIHKLPILFTLTEAQRSKGEVLFQTLDNPRATEEEIQHSLEFLRTQEDFIAKLSDKVEQEQIFRREVLGKSSKLLPDLDEVYQYLVSQVSSDVYSWYNSQKVVQAVETLAKNKYFDSAYKQAETQIDSMTPEETKEYLKRLIKENHRVGIEIISKGDD